MSDRLKIAVVLSTITMLIGFGLGLTIGHSTGSGLSLAASADPSGSGVGLVVQDPNVNLATLKATPASDRDLFVGNMGADQLLQLWRLADLPYTGGDTTWVTDVAREMRRRGLTTEPTTVAPVAPVVAAVPAGPATSFGPGIHTVGDEVVPGIYKTSGPTGIGCYYERVRSLDGEFSSIIANGNFAGPATIQVKASDAAIKITGSCMWTKK